MDRRASRTVFDSPIVFFFERLFLGEIGVFNNGNPIADRNEIP